MSLEPCRVAYDVEGTVIDLHNFQHVHRVHPKQDLIQQLLTDMDVCAATTLLEEPPKEESTEEEEGFASHSG